jgi:hypothetical protein
MPRETKTVGSAALAATVAQPEVSALSFEASAEARAHAHAMGADISGLLEQLKLQLAETRQIVSTLIWLTPPGDDQRPLKSLMRKLCWALGSVDLHAP